MNEIEWNRVVTAVRTAEFAELASPLRLHWQPIAEYDCRSYALFRVSTLFDDFEEAFGRWSDEAESYVCICGTETTPLHFAPDEFSYVADEVAFDLMDP